MEEQIIALICINQYVNIRKGHCINFAKDISKIAETLPRLPEDMPIVIIEKAANNPNLTSPDLKVRSEYVLKWLQWLKNYHLNLSNSYRQADRVRAIQGYAKLNIDYDRIRELPEDGPMPGLKIIVDPDLTIPEPRRDAENDDADIDGNAISNTVFPNISNRQPLEKIARRQIFEKIKGKM